MVVTPGERPAQAKPVPGGPDLASVDRGAWPVRPLALELAGKGGPIPIVFRQSALEAIYAHAQENREIEICGVLVGGGYVAPESGENGESGEAGKPYLYIAGSIRGEHAGSQVAQVTFTAETWQHIHTTMDRDWPDERIIGWYHTHPNFGIFLSEMDLFIHTSFFGAGDQLAFVYDAIREEEGLFAWKQGAPEKTTYLIDSGKSATASGTTAGSGLEGKDSIFDKSDPEAARLVREVEARRRRRRLSLLLILGLSVLVALALLQLSSGGDPDEDEPGGVESRRVEPGSSGEGDDR